VRDRSPANRFGQWEAGRHQADLFPDSQFSSVRAQQAPERPELVLSCVPANGDPCTRPGKADSVHARLALAQVFRRPGRHVLAAVPVGLRADQDSAMFRGE